MNPDEYRKAKRNMGQRLRQQTTDWRWQNRQLKLAQKAAERLDRAAARAQQG
jgi:hypothetical protein